MTTSNVPRRVPPASEWDEADLLSAAGTINELVACHEWISWGCVVLELLDRAGSLRAAYDLAHAARTTYLHHLPLDWTGEQGHRLVRLHMTMDVAMVTACPTCLAAPAQPCIKLLKGKPTRASLKWPHQERELAVLDQRDIDAAWGTHWW